MKLTRIPRANREQNLPNIDASHSTIRLAESTPHTRLQPIGARTRQHLVDADDMVGMRADTEMEAVFAAGLDEVFVGADTGRFKCFRGELFVLVRDEVDAAGELVDVGAFAAEIEDADFGVGYTAVEAGFGVWLVKSV